MMGKLAELSFREWCWLISAIVTLPLVALLLRYRGFKRTEKLLAKISFEPSEADRSATVAAAARMVDVAARRGLYRAQCLDQAITLWWMLGLTGISTTVRLGIYQNKGVVEAHAWVIYQGETVLGDSSDLTDYVPVLDVNVDRQP